MNQPSDPVTADRLRLLDETSARGWWTEGELATYFDVEPATLDRWRDDGAGPPWYVTDDGEARYNWGEVGAWTLAQELVELEGQLSRQRRRPRRGRR